MRSAVNVSGLLATIEDGVARRERAARCVRRAERSPHCAGHARVERVEVLRREIGDLAVHHPAPASRTEDATFELETHSLTLSHIVGHSVAMMRHLSKDGSVLRAPTRILNGSPVESRSLATLRRGLDILEELAAASSTRGLDHASLGRRLGLTRSTLYRYLACLQDTGYIEETGEAGRYRLGARIVYLAAVTHGREFSDLSRDAVRELAAVTGHTAHATVYDHPRSVTIQIASGSSPIEPNLRVGASRPLHCCASGKVFLAYERPAVVQAFLATRLPSRTANTITDPAQLRRAIAEVKQNGFAVDQAESYPGICGLAAPVFDFTGSVVGTLSVIVLTERLSGEAINELHPPLARSASALSQRLGSLVSTWRAGAVYRDPGSTGRESAETSREQTSA
jgi:IclR family transcriptional regulator, KDG regulon repressor